LSHQPSCPIDRTACKQHKFRSLQENPLAFRIWSSIQVKCETYEFGCSWTGSIADYREHLKKCKKKKRENEGGRLNQKLKDKLEVAEARNKELQGKLRDLEAENTALKMECHELQEFVEELSEQSSSSNGNLKPQLLDSGDYHYDRTSVVELTKLICQDLESKPDEIDSDKIYDCVKCIYEDLQGCYLDNPEYLHLDVRMLLGTCTASTWFSSQQLGSISKWMDEQGWG
jgi:hypothetical protein